MLILALALCVLTTLLKPKRRWFLLNLTFSKFVIKPILAVMIMGICSYFSYLTLLGIIPQKLATIIAITIAIIIYALAIIALKVFSKEELQMINK